MLDCGATLVLVWPHEAVVATAAAVLKITDVDVGAMVREGRSLLGFRSIDGH